ncbi:MAG: alpha/beta hydrolase [Limnospira sp.]
MFDRTFPYPELENPSKLPEPLRHSRVKLSQGQIFWREVGTGPDVVFLHGSWQDGSQWLPIVEELAAKYHCCVPDRLGCGESESANVHHSIAVGVENLAEYVAALKLETVYLVGHSLGGWIAASYALKYPEKVKGLILLSPEGVNVEGLPQRWRWMRWLSANPPIFPFVLKLVHPFLRLLGRGDAIADGFKLREKMLRSPSSCEFLFRRRTAELKAELLNDRLGFLKVPVLILQGSRDGAIAPSISQTYNSLIPQSELHFINAGGENLPAELPVIVGQYIRQFCKGKSVSELEIPTVRQF